MDSPLLLVGETGTGKDVFAKACHLYSVRGNQPFLGLNCASMPDDVVETELFGYAAGAYANSTEPKKVSLNRPTAAPFCWMKSRKCPRRCRSNCCAS